MTSGVNYDLPYLIVFGSRTFNDYELLCSKLDQYTRDLGKLIVVTGAAKGADTLGDRWATERKHTRMIFYPDWDLGKRAGPIRNQEMIDHVLRFPHRFATAFWDGKSTGTTDMVDRCQKNKIPLRIVRF